MSDLVGRRLGRYEIVSLLGAGGMGEVYLARDDRLGRKVAVKVLTARAAENPERLARFRREAKTVAQLSHPNILAIHDFGIDGGVAYAVTELLEGKDLRERLRSSGLPLTKAIEIGKTVALGLAAAHGRGIIHRDIKPPNIFVTATGQVKILDFGVARLKADAEHGSSEAAISGATETMAGEVLGTAGYMSPEQVKGAAVDTRSDIFSLGCLLYEMLAGRRAFRCETPRETMLAILDRDPTPIAEIRPDVPPALDHVVRRCLEKEPDERFESARDVAFALQALSDARDTVAPPRPARRRPGVRAAAVAAAVLAITVAGILGLRTRSSATPTVPRNLHIAVMSFQAPDGNPRLQDLARGLKGCLGDGLALLEHQEHGRLWFVPASDLELLGAEATAEAHRIFDINLAITGNLDQPGERLRLVLRAVDPATGRLSRQGVVEEPVGNLTSFQVEPVLRLAEMLDVGITQQTRDLLDLAATSSLSSFENYLLGRGSMAPDDPSQVNHASERLREAVELDPLFAAARVTLAHAYLEQHAISGDTTLLELARQEAEQAIDSTMHGCAAYCVLGAVHRANGDLKSARVAFEAAVAASPGNAQAHVRLGRLNQLLGRTSEAERHLQRAAYLRPGYWLGPHWLARLYLSEGRYEAAANSFRDVIACSPLYVGGHNNLGTVFKYLERPDEAEQQFERSLEIQPENNYPALANLGTLYFDRARYGDAAAMYQRALEVRDSDYSVWGNLGYALKSGAEPGQAHAPFRKAITLAEQELAQEPNNAAILTDLATYHSGLGERETALGYLEAAIAEGPNDPQIIATIGGTFEDLGNREEALIWVHEAFQNGVPRSRFETRPSLRSLVADHRYQQMIASGGPVN